MPSILLPSRYTQQPQQSALIDRSNALGAKVIDYLPLGQTIRAEVSGRMGTRGASGSFAAGTKGGSLRGSGASMRASIALDLSKYSAITVSFWLYWDAYANNDALAMEFCPQYSGTGNAGFLVDPNCSSPAGMFMFGVGGDGSNLSAFARPPASQWNRITLTLNRAAALNAVGKAYVNGTPQALSAVSGNTAINTANFLSSTLNLFSRNGASLFGTGNLQDLTIYQGTLSDAEALSDFSNPYQIIRAPTRRWWVASAAYQAILALTERSSTTPAIAATARQKALAVAASGSGTSAAIAAVGRHKALVASSMQSGLATALAVIARHKASIATSTQSGTASTVSLMRPYTAVLATSTQDNAMPSLLARQRHRAAIASGSSTATSPSLSIGDGQVIVLKVDASQAINQLPIGSVGKRNLERLINGLIDDVERLRASRMKLLAKLDADAGIAGSDYTKAAGVPASHITVIK